MMDTFKRLECEFSVIKFGERADLLKYLSDPATDKMGQMVLEAFSFDEGTNLHSGVRGALEKGFISNVPRSQIPGTVVHRCVIVMTDGIVGTHETDRAAYAAAFTAAAQQHKVRPSFCILGIMDEATAAMETEIRAGMHFLSGSVSLIELFRVEMECVSCRGCVGPTESGIASGQQADCSVGCT